jgi:hypothetical protein
MRKKTRWNFSSLSFFHENYFSELWSLSSATCLSRCKRWWWWWWVKHALRIHSCSSRHESIEDYCCYVYMTLSVCESILRWHLRVEHTSIAYHNCSTVLITLSVFSFSAFVTLSGNVVLVKIRRIRFYYAFFIDIWC